MIDTNVIETRIKWLEQSITDTLAWGLDDNTDPSLLKHTMDTESALSLELGQRYRDLKHAQEINARKKS
jgi:hypothetical protein